MAYASVPDIRTMISIKTIDGQSDPSIQQVAQIINDVAADVDTVLSSGGYDVPVSTTATVAWGFLRQLNAYGAAMRVEASGAKGEKSEHLAFLERQFNRRWDQLIKGDISLAGVEASAESSAPRAGGIATSMFSIYDER